MKKREIDRQRFISLRVLGFSYEDTAKILGLSRRSLYSYTQANPLSKKEEKEFIKNQKQELEAWQEKLKELKESYLEGIRKVLLESKSEVEVETETKTENLSVEERKARAMESLKKKLEAKGLRR